MSFSSFRVFFSTSSSMDPNFSSASAFLDSWSRISFAILLSASCLRVSSCLAFRSSASWVAALSNNCPPFNNLFSMPFSLAASWRFRCDAFLRSVSWRTRSARRRSRSSSVAAWRSNSAASWRSARSRISSFFRSASAWTFDSSSSDTPTVTSLMTSLWTIFSTSLYSFCSPCHSPFSSYVPFPWSCALRRAISSWNSRSMASFGSSLILGLFLMFLALLA
mmetsp:Transcript_8772/g.25040  ORF Transcript_8772/g.25040 Transcript_8772/m.25040 type:complete len:221 (+) Transcript_8772:653-1315(+)